MYSNAPAAPARLPPAGPARAAPPPPPAARSATSPSRGNRSRPCGGGGGDGGGGFGDDVDGGFGDGGGGLVVGQCGVLNLPLTPTPRSRRLPPTVRNEQMPTGVRKHAASTSAPSAPSTFGKDTARQAGRGQTVKPRRRKNAGERGSETGAALARCTAQGRAVEPVGGSPNQGGRCLCHAVCLWNRVEPCNR